MRIICKCQNPGLCSHFSIPTPHSQWARSSSRCRNFSLQFAFLNYFEPSTLDFMETLGGSKSLHEV
jgi:hypothetical protein